MPSIIENFHRHFWNVSTNCVVYVDKIGQLTVKELQFFIDWKIAQSKFKWRLYAERKDKQSHHNATPYQSCLTWCCNGVQYVWTLLMLQLVQHFPHFFVGIIYPLRCYISRTLCSLMVLSFQTCIFFEDLPHELKSMEIFLMRSLSSLGDPAIHPIRKIIDLVGNPQTGGDAARYGSHYDGIWTPGRVTHMIFHSLNFLKSNSVFWSKLQTSLDNVSKSD